jgi:glycosyltransferase involved in cell wall biosynthesis
LPTAAVVSYRLGGPDGVSVEAAKWIASLHRLGWRTTTIAGRGEADLLLAGLGLEDAAGPDPEALEAALAPADLVIVENVCSLPLNPAASRAVAWACRGRPAVLRHHDLPWQRATTSDATVPDDPRWRHVTINDLSRQQLARRAIDAVTIRNAFDTDAAPGDRESTRAGLGVGPGDRLAVQPTRAIARKNIPAALALSAALDAIYWLLGPAEEGYHRELDRLLAAARSSGTTCIHAAAARVADAYAAADVVTFPSTWEGFGNPVVESAVHGKPLAIGTYPVAAELAGFGFRWLDAADHAAVRHWLDRPDPAWLEHNRAVARRWFSFDTLDRAVADLLDDVVGRP